MKTSPDFSVILPVYNKASSIRRAVESVLSQDYQEFELIVVDDGSTDGSLDLLSEISDDRMTLVRQNNMGGAGGQARNTGMKQAQGEWFAFLDGDDVWQINHLRELAEIVQRYPEAGLVSPKPVEAPDGASIPIDDRPRSNIRRVDYFHEAARHIGFLNCSSAAIHRDVHQKLGGFINVKSGPDLEYWARVALDFPVTISDRITSVYYRGNDGNMELIARQAMERSRPITQLGDISPSVAMLCERAESDPHVWIDTSIRDYINSRVVNGVRGALHRGDIDTGQHLSQLLLPPLGWRYRAYAVSLQYVPKGIIAAALTLRRNLKSIAPVTRL